MPTLPFAQNNNTGAPPRVIAPRILAPSFDRWPARSTSGAKGRVRRVWAIALAFFGPCKVAVVDEGYRWERWG